MKELCDGSITKFISLKKLKQSILTLELFCDRIRKEDNVSPPPSNNDWNEEFFRSIVLISVQALQCYTEKYKKWIQYETTIFLPLP